MKINPKTVLYASDTSDDAVADAKSYIARMGFTKDDVKLIQKSGQTLVVAIREVWGE